MAMEEKKRLYPIIFEAETERHAWGTETFMVADIGIVDSVVKNGWLDAETYGKAARKAWIQLVSYLNADGELTESQRWEIDAYTKAQADQNTADAVSAHNSSPTAHPAILARLAEVETEVEAINLKFGTEVNGNPFTVTFVTLDDVTVSGVWNQAQARIEF